MNSRRRTYVVRELTDYEADSIVAELQRVERAGHRIADVSHDGGVWRIFAFDRRVHDDERMGLISFRRRATD